MPINSFPPFFDTASFSPQWPHASIPEPPGLLTWSCVDGVVSVSPVDTSPGDCPSGAGLLAALCWR
jgi:hypothetical protein